MLFAQSGDQSFAGLLIFAIAVVLAAVVAFVFRDKEPPTIP
jgi:hypothetical protein